MDGLRDGWTDGEMDGGMDGGADGWMVEWMAGRLDFSEILTCSSQYQWKVYYSAF